MKKFFNLHTLLLLVVFYALLQIAAYGQGFLKADGKKIVNEKGNEIILRGMGLGGWMLQEGYMLKVGKIQNQQHKVREKIEELIGKEKTDLFYKNWLANHTRKIDIDSMAAWGFNSVRLPIHYNLFTLPAEAEPVKNQHTWLEKGFTMTDSLLQWCKANRMYLILDLHAAPGGQGHDYNISDGDANLPSLWESEANQQKMVALWQKLAERYVNEPWIGAYDIINEPNWGFEKTEDKNGCGETKNEPLRKLMVATTNAIREIDKKHIIIIEGNCWGNNYNGIFPLWDNNLVVSFHKYWNYNDKASIQRMLDVREQYNVPLWLGETGENSNVWFTDAIRLAESHKIGWSWWPLKKIGFNNPLEIKLNPDYQKVLDFWNGKREKPILAEAEKAFVQLASDTRLENCIYHKDVTDAMFRQVYSRESIPFGQNTVGRDAIIYAVNFDLGSNEVAYFDKDTANYHVATGKRTAGNKGYIYRNDGVDIETCKDNITNGFQVVSTEDGEWLQYTIMAEKSGKYLLKLRTASEQQGGMISVLVNKMPVTEHIPVPQTGNLQNWQTLILKKAILNKGKNVIRIQIEKGGFTINYLQLTRE